MLNNITELDSTNLSEEDKNFVEARNKIPKYEISFGEYGAILGLFLLIFVAFKETFKVLRKN